MTCSFTHILRCFDHVIFNVQISCGTNKVLHYNPKTKVIHVWIPCIETKEPTIIKVNKVENYAALRNIYIYGIDNIPHIILHIV